jgi:hypothetical protein
MPVLPSICALDCVADQNLGGVQHLDRALPDSELFGDGQFFAWYRGCRTSLDPFIDLPVRHKHRRAHALALDRLFSAA